MCACVYGVLKLKSRGVSHMKKNMKSFTSMAAKVVMPLVFTASTACNNDDQLPDSFYNLAPDKTLIITYPKTNTDPDGFMRIAFPQPNGDAVNMRTGGDGKGYKTDYDLGENTIPVAGSIDGLTIKTTSADTILFNGPNNHKMGIILENGAIMHLRHTNDIPRTHTRPDAPWATPTDVAAWKKAIEIHQNNLRAGEFTLVQPKPQPTP